MIALSRARPDFRLLAIGGKSEPLVLKVSQNATDGNGNRGEDGLQIDFVKKYQKERKIKSD